MIQSTPSSMPRVEVRRRRTALRPGRHEHVREAGHGEAEERRWSVRPLLLQRLPADTADVDPVVGARDGIEACRVDDDVELVLPRGGANASWRDPLDRRLLQVHEMDVVPVERLVIARLQRHTLHAEAVILGNQLLGEHRVVHPRADLVGDELGELGVGLLVDEDVTEVRQPDAEARLAIQLLPLGEALLAWHLVERPTVRLVDEPAGRARTQVEDVVVTGLDVGHLGRRDLTVVQRSAPVRSPLEHRQLADLVGDLTDHLHARRAGADHRNPLAGQLDRLGGPVEGVERRTLRTRRVPRSGATWEPTTGRSP